MAASKSQSAEALLQQLKNPFDPRFVKWRVGATNKEKTKGIALAYIDAREVKKRFDDVCGIDGWEDELTACDGGFVSVIKVRMPDNEWRQRSGAAGNTKVEAIKGGASDAFKRAAAKWGVGHYLYYLPNKWVPIVQKGATYALAETPELPKWALPGQVENWEDIAEMEAEMSSGADDLNADDIISNVDKIRGATSKEELEMVVESFEPSDRIVLANQIQAKQRELLHENSIHPNNS